MRLANIIPNIFSFDTFVLFSILIEVIFVLGIVWLTSCELFVCWISWISTGNLLDTDWETGCGIC